MPSMVPFLEDTLAGISRHIFVYNSLLLHGGRTIPGWSQKGSGLSQKKSLHLMRTLKGPFFWPCWLGENLPLGLV